jgi:hypothetical protein
LDSTQKLALKPIPNYLILNIKQWWKFMKIAGTAENEPITGIWQKIRIRGAPVE